MDKNKICIFVVFMLLITGMTTIVTAERVNKTKSKDRAGQIADIDIYISRNKEYIEDSIGTIVISEWLRGTYSAGLTVRFARQYIPYSIEGSWSAKIYCEPISGSGERVVFYDMSDNFAYGNDEPCPDVIYFDVNKELNGNYEVHAELEVHVTIFENGVEVDQIDFSDSWAQSKIKNKDKNSFIPIIRLIKNNFKNFDLINILKKLSIS